MEHQLINALIDLITRAGGQSLVRDLNLRVDENNDPEAWTPDEIAKAVAYIKWQVGNFGTPEASAVVEALIKKYNLHPENFIDRDPLRETQGVQGLQ